MKFSWICGIIFGSAFLLAGTALGQGQISIEPPTPSGGGGSMPIAPPTATMPATAQPSSAPATAPAASIPSAESVLQQLLNNKAGATADHAEALSPIMPIGPVLGADGLLREGQQIEMRSGHLKKDESAEGTGAIIFVFDPKETPVYPPMGVIPSLRRAAMEDAAGFGEGRVGSDMTFRILAEVTEYRGKNYLYIRPSGIPVPAPAAQVAPAVKPLVNAAAPNVPAAQPLPERDAITNRIGRLVRDVKTGVELIAFDADGQRMADPPMGVIPCKYLAVIEDATDNGNKPLKFRVSGEVTSYRGKNYLYLKFVQQVRDLNGGIGAGTAVGG